MRFIALTGGVLCGSQDGRGSCQLALGVDQVCGVRKVATAVTLIAPGILHREEHV